MPKPSLCLNMIVKNEAARIERCLASVSPYIKTYSILDTGSTDGTQAIIKDYFDGLGIGGSVHDGYFQDFSQARNAAFHCAQVDNEGGDQPWCQFALLVDADMELVVDDPKAFENLDAAALSYDMMQKGGAISYGNRRVLNLNIQKPPYVGVTHEYIDVPAAGMIKGASFVDHADGANRKDKYERDARLLEEALKTDPDNARYLYYLGNTYRDWGKPGHAINAYHQRITLGGWDEETHSAMMNEASSYKDGGDPEMFVSGMIGAFNFRPRRAEPLYELAKHYREKGDNAAALIFAKAGVNIKRPNDLLFVNDFVYSHGLRYEYSIAGYYNEAERARAFEVTDDLALDPACPAEFRLSARNNLFFHTKPLVEWCSSFKATKLNFNPPDGYVAMNPSVEECNGNIKCNIRCVNYRMDSAGRYLINGTDGEANGTNPIDTRNFIARLDVDLKVKDAAEVLWHRDLAKFNLVTGLEDIRLYRSRGELWFSACVREQSPFGTCQQARGRLVQDIDPHFMLVQETNPPFMLVQETNPHFMLVQETNPPFMLVSNFEIMSGDLIHEKNWMPMGDQKFVYRLDTILQGWQGSLHQTEKFPLKICPDNISGSSQLIPFKSGWLAVVHEAITGPDGKRTYWHRFAWFEQDGRLRRLSKPFVFFDRQIEFCAGLAYHPNRRDLIISFGVRDAEAWLATVAIEEVATMCWKFHEG